jgi:Fe-S-cluster-containing hydrogenase component 2
MRYQIDSRCKQCGKCCKNCPANAIVKRSSQYVIITEKCKYCGICAHICPVGAITCSETFTTAKIKNTNYNMPIAYSNSRTYIGGHSHHAGRRHQHDLQS